MAMCKFCGKPFTWGNADGKWIPLVPIGEDEELDRDYQDENGALRAGHRNICVMAGGPSVMVSKLVRKIPAKEILPAVDKEEFVGPRKKRGRPRKAQLSGAGI